MTNATMTLSAIGRERIRGVPFERPSVLVMSAGCLPRYTAGPASASRGKQWESDDGYPAKGGTLSAVKIVAVVLIVGGILGLVYGSFTYTKSSREAKLGPLEFEVKEKERVNVPVWAGVGAIVLGA